MKGTTIISMPNKTAFTSSKKVNILVLRYTVHPADIHVSLSTLKYYSMPTQIFIIHTAKLISQRYVWPGVQKDCRTWARACHSCQRSKISRHITTPLGNFALPTSRFQHVHIDIVGPLPTSDGFRYCLTAVDRFTRWPEAIPMQASRLRRWPEPCCPDG